MGIVIILSKQKTIYNLISKDEWFHKYKLVVLSDYNNMVQFAQKNSQNIEFIIVDVMENSKYYLEEEWHNLWKPMFDEVTKIAIVHSDEFEKRLLKYENINVIRMPEEKEELMQLKLRHIFGKKHLEIKKCNICSFNKKYVKSYDELTQIYNHSKFILDTQYMIKRNSHVKFLLIQSDIKGFKIIDDIFGIGEGDKLLKNVADSIRKICKNYNVSTYGRAGADIFHMCVPDEKRESLLYDLEHILDEYNLEMKVDIYFGVYEIEDNDFSVDMMCDRADLALKTIKGSCMSHVAFYDENLRKQIIGEQEIVVEMNEALKNREFKVYMQPKYELKGEKLIGAEALVRWAHPKKGIIFPGKFIPIFEKNGFIMKLDYYMWENVCATIRKWMDEGKHVNPISVNVSRINLYDKNICSKIIGLVEKYKVPPKFLQLEITESAYTNSAEELNRVIDKLQRYGFTILMDDFGSGYSSLNMLKNVNVNVLKIDLRFLSDEGNSQKGASIITSIVKMAKWLEMPVIAEGIENKFQAEFLRNIGCEEGQGYYYARPMPVEEFENIMNL